MKQLITLAFSILLTAMALGQSNVFVLVDVSKSVKVRDLQRAKQALTDVLAGNALSNVNVIGNAQDLAAYKLSQNDKLSIVKFGDKPTILGNPPSPASMQSMPGDIYQQVNNSFPTSLTDNRTYITLAKAKIAEYAKNNGIKQYRLCVITDNINDDYGPGGQPDYTDYERQLAETYGTTTSGVVQALSTKIKLTGSINPGYVLEFVPKVDITNYVLPQIPNTGTVVDTTVDRTPVIKLLSNAGGKKGNEAELKSDNLNVHWSCNNCPQGGKFTVTISEYDGGRFRNVKKDLYSGFSIKVQPGKYKVTVSAQNFSASPDTTYVKVGGGGSGWLIALLAIAALAAIGYYVWNKKRQQKVESGSTKKEDDLFSKTKPPGGGSSGSEYF